MLGDHIDVGVVIVHLEREPRGKLVPKKMEIFGGQLLSEDDHSHWAPPYWNIMKEIFSLGRTEV